ncbi:putative glutamate carboxypeptidase II [Helianthus annuus]|nr:putative glutamate carboxypeptidase II [Helianthus annuus]
MICVAFGFCCCKYGFERQNTDGIYNFSHRTLSCIDGKIYRGDIVENAYDAGAMGVLIYSDRKDYGGGRGGTKWFPDDTWLPPGGVQVGSVLNGAGDPTTPGWPSSMEGCERLSEDEVERAGDIPLIPSLPISGADGEEILRWIGGVVAEDEWQGDEDAPVYRIGRVQGLQNSVIR